MSRPDGVRRMSLSKIEEALTHLRSMMDGGVAGHWAWVACIGVMKGWLYEILKSKEDPRGR
jgi:hypothetical protein